MQSSKCPSDRFNRGERENGILIFHYDDDSTGDFL